MFMKNKTHLTRLFIYPAYFSPENRLKSLGEKEKETGIRMDEKDQNPAILNSGPIQKHLVDLQTRVSSNPYKPRPFNFFFFFSFILTNIEKEIEQRS